MAKTLDRARLRGLYAITPDGGEPSRLPVLVAAALDGGAGLVQFRAKSGAKPGQLALARSLSALCRARGAIFIVNDDVEFALACGADGVHLGREDGDPREIRRRWPEGVIGVSCYAEPALAVRAAADGADYIGIGSVFPSATKPGAVRAPLEVIREARHLSGLPVAAIGGITPANAGAAYEAGADMVAVISSLFDAPDVARAARSLCPQPPRTPSSHV